MPSRPTSSRSARGLSESVQWAVLTPLVLMVLLGLIHAGVLMHGRGVAGQEGGNARVEVRAHVDSFMPAGLTRVASIAWQPVEVPR